jgi:hypothetical protein
MFPLKDQLDESILFLTRTIFGVLPSPCPTVPDVPLPV